MDKGLAEIIRRSLCEYLGFLQHKIECGSLTLDEECALLRLLEESLRISATVEDLAGYYGKTPEAIRTVIHRRMLSKPKRRVMYSFREFARIIPEKWRK